MNLKKIKEILNLPLPEELLQRKVLEIIAEDPQAIEYVLTLLEFERSKNKELLTDMNILLSKAHTGLENPKLNKDNFMVKEITEFYQRGLIGHCFKNIPSK